MDALKASREVEKAKALLISGRGLRSQVLAHLVRAVEYLIPERPETPAVEVVDGPPGPTTNDAEVPTTPTADATTAGPVDNSGDSTTAGNPAPPKKSAPKARKTKGAKR